MKMPNLVQSFQHDFVSEADAFLSELRSSLPKSASQIETIAKHEKISALRDDPNAGSADKVIWEAF